MDRMTIAIEPAATKLRRVGRVARHRMRIDGAALANGRHTDGTVTIEISGLGSTTAGMGDAFEWHADRPIALVIVRSAVDGKEVSFDVGPSRHGVTRAAAIGDGGGIRYVAFCYDAPGGAGPRATAERPAGASPEDLPGLVGATEIHPAVLPTPAAAPAALGPTGRERRSILGMLLARPRLGAARS